MKDHLGTKLIGLFTVQNEICSGLCVSGRRAPAPGLSHLSAFGRYAWANSAHLHKDMSSLFFRMTSSTYQGATRTLQQQALPSSTMGCNFMCVLSHRSRCTKVCLLLPASSGNPTLYHLPKEAPYGFRAWARGSGQAGRRSTWWEVVPVKPTGRREKLLGVSQ